MIRKHLKDPDDWCGPLTFGVDPDLHTTPIVAIRGRKILKIEVVRVSNKLKDRDAAVAMSRALPIRISSFVNTLYGTLGNPAFDKGTWSLACVEGQQKYPNSPQQPNDLINLSLVAGVAIGAFETAAVRTHCPLPMTWKGQIAKPISQARILDCFNIQSTSLKTYSRPTDQELMDIPCLIDSLIKPTDWKHITDALGLAYWCGQNPTL